MARVLVARRWLVVAAAVLVSAFLLQCIAFVRANAQTYDEAITLAAGYRLVHDGRNDVNIEHPPLAKAIAALPLVAFASPRLDLRSGGFALGRDFLYAGPEPATKLLALGRAPMVVLALALVVSIGWWAFRLWGPASGILALALACFDPNLVAHGSLVGHDAPLALFVTLTFACAWAYDDSSRIRWLVAAGVAAGLALATKHSGLFSLATLGVAQVAAAVVRGEATPWWSEKASTRAGAIVAAAGNWTLAASIALLVLRLTLGRDGFAPYIAGFQAQLAHQRAGHPAFLLGDISRTGWVTYFPIALAVKTPPLTLLALGASLGLANRGTRFGRAAPYVLLPCVALFGALLAARVDIGARYALPLTPLAIVAASRVATIRLPVPATAAALALGLTHHVVAACRIAPHDLAFFSDVAGGPTRGRRILADSNLDWGQDLTTLARWLDGEPAPHRLFLSYFGTAAPESYGVRYWPAPTSCLHPSPWTRALAPTSSPPGRDLLAVSVMNLQGVFFDDPRAYAWLEDRTPVVTLGHTIVVYDVSDAKAHAELARLFARYGPHDAEGDGL